MIQRDIQSGITEINTLVVGCAPPENKPTPTERDSCRAFMEEELEVLTRVWARARQLIT